MIPEQKRKALIEQWKINPSVLEALERQNVKDAEMAASEGRESKEANVVKDEVVENAAQTAQAAQTEQVEQVEQVPAEKTENVVVPTTPADYPTREEIADAFGTILGEMRGQMDTLSSVVLELTKEVKGIKESDETKIANAVKDVPAASLSALLSRSIVGQSAAAIDGRSSLGKDKPKETQANTGSQYGIPFIERLVNGATQD